MGYIEIDLPSWFIVGSLVCLGIYVVLDCLDKILKYYTGRLKRNIAYEKKVNQLLSTIEEMQKDSKKALSDTISLKREVLRRRIFHDGMIRELELYEVGLLNSPLDDKQRVEKVLEKIKVHKKDLILNNKKEVYLTVTSFGEECDKVKGEEF